MDYLSVQGSAIPCECIFLCSGETNTKKRNHMKPMLMEALQMLKFYLKKSCLDFSIGLLLNEKELEDDDPEDLLGVLISNNINRADTSLDKILQMFEEDEVQCEEQEDKQEDEDEADEVQ